MAKTTKKHLSQKDKFYWEQLYTYVRRNVMGYDENQSLSKNMVLRLKGLLTNKFMANNNIEDTSNYSYEIILLTFKFCMPDIQRGLQKNTFNDENHKFAYILKIVESNINTVYIRMKNAEKMKEEAQNKVVNTIEHCGAEYKPKKKIKDKYSDMW